MLNSIDSFNLILPQKRNSLDKEENMSDLNYKKSLSYEFSKYKFNGFFLIFLN